MQFESYIKAVAIKTVQNGGTASKPATQTFLPVQDLWCFPKYPSKTSILPSSVDLIEELKNFILRNKEFLNEEECWLGTWVHPQTGEYYLDVSTGIDDLETALEIAVQAGKREGRHIVAIFNLQRNNTVFLEQP